ncbi:MAG: hypothetical protein IH934_03185 [Nanoarchaeota archaeon]|nr:hypothetical protein [Nanoarchaeota archaeon]
MIVPEEDLEKYLGNDLKNLSGLDWLRSTLEKLVEFNDQAENEYGIYGVDLIFLANQNGESWHSTVSKYGFGISMDIMTKLFIYLELPIERDGNFEG